jgi:hypothetical protein
MTLPPEVRQLPCFSKRAASPGCRGLRAALTNLGRAFGAMARAVRETQCAGLACRWFWGVVPRSPAVGFCLRSLAACVSLSTPAPLATWVRWQSRRFPRIAC